MPTKNAAPKPKKDAFGIDADPAEFSIDDWLSGATLPTRSAKIYRDAAAYARIMELADRFDDLAAQVKADESIGEDGPDRDLTEESALSKQYEVAQQIQQIRDGAEQSAVWVRVRSITSDEAAKLNAKIKDSKDDAKVYPLLLAVAARIVVHDQEQPPLTPAQWTKFRESVGMKQFQKVIHAYDDANGLVQASDVMPDFSPDVSERLAMKES